MTASNPIGPTVPDWTARPRPERAPLEGRYARLEPLDPARHGPDLWDAFSKNPNKGAWTYRLQEPFARQETLDDWLREIAPGEDPLYFAYIDKATGRAAGNGGFMSIQPSGGSIEIGSIMIAPPLARARGGTEALILMIRWCFEAGYRRLEWTCNAHNAPSRAAARRLGFSYELTFREALVAKGRNRDTAVFSIIDKDWPELAAIYDAWLDPANFDEAGVQQKSLSEMTAPLRRAEPPPPPDGERNAFDQPLARAVANWSPPPAPPKAPAEGLYVRLEPLDPDLHAEALFAANAGADEMWDYMPCGPFADFAAYRAWMEAEALGDDQLFYALVDRADGRAKGVASYLRINPAHGSIEVGNIAFSPSIQRTRAATEAMYLMMARAFDLGYRRYEWKCNALNAPSRRAATRLGFTYEGEFAQALVVKGRNRDTSWFAILAHEWPAKKAAFEAWLDPSNFDAEGRQKTPLA